MAESQGDTGPDANAVARLARQGGQAESGRGTMTAEARDGTSDSGDPPRARSRVGTVAILLLAGFAVGAVAFVYLTQSPEGVDVAGRPGASVWLRSVIRRDDGELRLDVDTSEVVVREGGAESRPGWRAISSDIEKTITQTGDPDSAPAHVTGTIFYLATTQRFSLAKLRRVTEFVTCTFEITGEPVPARGSVRWWRLRRVDPTVAGAGRSPATDPAGTR